MSSNNKGGVNLSYHQFAYCYDRLMDEMPYPEWIRFVRECWDRYGKPLSLADLGCGTGTIAIPLAQSGVKVFGIDLSEDMLAVASSKQLEPVGRSAGSSGSVTWLQQDIREWQLAHPVDCAISLCDCMNYILEEEEILQVFRHTYDGLAERGLFIFDMHTRYQFEEYAAEQPFVLNEEDIAYIWTVELDHDRCQVEHSLSIFAQESGTAYRRIDEVHRQRVYSVDWIRGALVKSGFHTVHFFADFEWDEPTEQSRRIFTIACKS